MTGSGEGRAVPLSLPSQGSLKKWQGKERIQGGRASVRRAIYLPDVVATRFNPDIKAKYEQLISSEKCKKLAITAVMRKLIVMANALLRDQRKWGEYPF